MRDGLITRTDEAAALVAFTANRDDINPLPDDVLSLNFKYPAITEAAHSLPPVVQMHMIFEVR